MNIVSMTGFGSACCDDDSVAITVEIKTVNSRFADFNIKMPKEYTPFEIELRKEVTNVLKRGRFDIYITKQVKSSSSENLAFNRPLCTSFMELYKDLLNEYKISDVNDSLRGDFLNTLLLKKEIVDYSQDSPSFDNEKSLLFSALHQAIEKVYEMRVIEGKSLAENLSDLFQELKTICQNILTLKDSVVDNYITKLKERISKLVPDIQVDQQRLAMEIALFADKVDITEEVTRLQSHLQQINLCAEQTPNGRTFDFLVQECGREFNTITSKIQSWDIQNLAVSGKACLEKIREQIQNIE